MTNNLTFAMIKPDAVQQKQMGAIIHMIEQAGFSLQALQLTQLTLQNARLFYEVHKERSFYEQMCVFIASGQIVAMVLQKENAVADFRKLIGATDPAQAALGTIRQKFGQSIEANAIHGSDAQATASNEIEFFFPSLNQ